MRSLLTRLVSDLDEVALPLMYLAAGLLVVVLTYGLLHDLIRRLNADQPRPPDQGEPVCQATWPVALVGALLVLVLIEFTIEAYFGGG